MTNQNFLNRLNELMIEHQIPNQRQLSIKTDIPYMTIRSWQDKDINPTLDRLIKLADFFSVPIDYLCGRVDDFGNPITNENDTQEHPPLKSASSSEANFPTLNIDEKKLIKNYRKIPDHLKDTVQTIAHELANTNLDFEKDQQENINS